MTAEEPRRKSPAWLHFRRFLARPRRVASLFASSPRLARLIAGQIRRDHGDYVIEIGAGIGTVTGAILAAGIPAEKLIAVEIDKAMAEHLRATYPDIRVLACSAFDLARALPPEVPGCVGSIVCGLPIRLFPAARQRELAEMMMSLLRPGGQILAYAHRLSSPIDAGGTRLAGRRLIFTFHNLPPASVWGYEPAAEG